MSDPELPLWQNTCREHLECTDLSDTVTADLAIIGGGYTGCSAALTAARAGASTVLLEAHDIGHGGSGRNVGLVNAGLWVPQDDIRAHLGHEAGNRLITLLAQAPSDVFQLIAEHDIACEPVRNGTLHCAHSPSGYRDIGTRHTQHVASGAPVELLSAQQVQQRTGSAAFHGALFDPRAGTIQPLAYVRGLARAAAGAGARVFQRSPVTSMAHDGHAWVLKTSRGEVRAKAVIQATNAYHQGLQGTAPSYVPVYYFQCATAPLPEALRKDILPGGEGCWDTGLIMTSFRMDREGRFIIGGMGDLGHIGRSVHSGWVRRKMAALFPALAGEPLVTGWHGRISMTSDHLPKIVSIGPRALSVHGYSGRGIGPGTVFGRLAAESLLSGDPSVLPVRMVDTHDERLPGMRRAFFESGAVATHLLKARF